MMPGAFHQLTGLSAEAAMDTFILLQDIFDDFDQKQFLQICLRMRKKFFKAI